MRIKIIDADLLGRKNHRFPNTVCMRLSAFHKQRGDEVSLVEDYNDIGAYDMLYCAKVFTDSVVPQGILGGKNVFRGGTGFFYDLAPELPSAIVHHKPDYQLYDSWVERLISSGAKPTEFTNYTDYSIGKITTGCFRRCGFCVNKNSTKVVWNASPLEFLEDSRPKIMLLDDQFLGYPKWRDGLDCLEEIGKPFQFKQGLDIRLITEEKAVRLAGSKYSGDYIFAFDDIDDAWLIIKKLRVWREATNKRTKFYVLCGYDKNGRYDEAFWAKDIIDTFKRIYILWLFDCLPYVMRFAEYKNSPWAQMYVSIASWANQPHLFKNRSFRLYCQQRGISAKLYTEYKQDTKKYCTDGHKVGSPWKTMEAFEKAYPQVGKFYDLMYGEQLKGAV